MSGGHKKANLRGSGGKLTPGDRKSEAVHGRRGMFRERREKGAGISVKYEKDAEDPEELDINEFTFIRIMNTRQCYMPSAMSWTDIKTQILLSLNINTDEEMCKFISGIQKKKPGWIIFNPDFPSECYLNPTHRRSIMDYLSIRYDRQCIDDDETGG